MQLIQLLKVLVIIIVLGGSVTFILSGNSMNNLFTSAGSIGESRKNIRVLFIGSSYTQGMPDILEVVSVSASDKDHAIETKSIIMPGASMDKLWHNPATLESIRNEKWDYVVLQGPTASQTLSFGYKTFELYGSHFMYEILQAGAKPVLFGSWPRAPGSDMYRKAGSSYSKLLAKINNDLYKAASRYNPGIVYTSQYFDAANRKGLHLYAQDNSHASLEGHVMIAMMFYHYFVPGSEVDCSLRQMTAYITEEKCNSVKSVVNSVKQAS